jgi:hypothetical protein
MDTVHMIQSTVVPDLVLSNLKTEAHTYICTYTHRDTEDGRSHDVSPCCHRGKQRPAGYMYVTATVQYLLRLLSAAPAICCACCYVLE